MKIINIIIWWWNDENLFENSPLDDEIIMMVLQTFGLLLRKHFFKNTEPSYNTINI